MPTPTQLEEARRLFETSEPRDLFYRVALELIDLSRGGITEISVAEALSVLLQTWNRRFYIARYRGKFPAAHFQRIEELLSRNADDLSACRERRLEDLTADDAAQARALFGAFECILGPVGAAKALHLLAPRYFPLWDRAIATASGCGLGPMGSNASRYWRFMQLQCAECRELGGEASWGEGLLKQLDEFNYCRHTLESI
jgi:hypothetical protein